MTNPDVTADESADLLRAEDLIADRALQFSDPDELKHLPIARRLADLITAAEAPANIALFGPWGSGKSSFAQLLRGCLENRQPKVGMVVYDAWTFEGESFQRNFISAAATGLELPATDHDNHEFHGGLYQGRRSARVSLSKWDVLKLLGLALGIAAIALLFLALLVAGIAQVVGEDPIAAVVQALPSLIPATTVAGLLGSITREILAGARIDVDESAPTQEQFRGTFRRLVDRAREKGSFERLVFFIDELDRCSPEQVMQVLAAIRHFYQLPHCVFVVAADREVVELAIQRKATHVTPANTEEPYYSSASEYIDKVFQFQIALPPLRNRRLTRFARDLVTSKKAGLWHEVTGGDEGRRDRLMYVLIPSHVRSPRRVKVLLNNFATNARIAEARGLSWRDRAYEIAKLTVLRTEFPHFATDLHLEPRLPDLVLDPPATVSRRLKELLEHHRLPDVKEAIAGSEKEDDGEGEGKLTPTDPIVAKGRSETISQITSAERINLRRYLLRTSAYDNPGRDLLFLEPAGAAVDLADDAFGDLIESDAIEDPTSVVAAAEDQPEDEVRKAMRVLADMVTQEFGQERANLTTTLIGMARLVEYAVSPYEDDVLGALKQHAKEEGLERDHLAGALAIATQAAQEDDEYEDEFVSELASDARLLDGREQIERAVMVTPFTTGARRELIWEALGENFAATPNIVHHPTRELPFHGAREMIAAIRPQMTAHLKTLDEEAVEELATGLFDAAAERSEPDEEVHGRLMWTLLNGGAESYAAAIGRIDALDSFTTALAYRNGLVLHAIQQAPPEDWHAWAARLSDLKSKWADESSRARDTIESVLKRWPSVGAHVEEAIAVLERLARLVSGNEDATLAEQIERQISIKGASWWTTAALTEAQHAVYRALLGFRTAGPRTHRLVSARVAEDVERALMASPTAPAFKLATEVAPLLDQEGAEYLATVVEHPKPAAPVDVERVWARLVVARAGQTLGADTSISIFAVSGEEMQPILATLRADTALELWLALNPPLGEGMKVMRSIGAAASRPRRAIVAKWASGLTSEERTDLVLDVLKLADDVSAWVESIQVAPLDDARIVREIGNRIRSAGQGPRREDLARTLAALRTTDGAAQKALGEIIEWLLDQGKKVDYNAAIIALRALGPNHGMGSRLATAFDRAQAEGRTPPGRARADLDRAKIPHRKRMFPDLFGRLRR